MSDFDVPGITYMDVDDELMTAVRQWNRPRAFQLISEGKDPFTMLRRERRAAFHYAADRRDLELLLHMIAKPGTAWTKKFLLCAQAVVDVPVQPRDCIAALYESSFLIERDSMEGWEVMVMFGYRLNKFANLDMLCHPDPRCPPEDGYRRLKFFLASMMFDATICDNSQPLLEFGSSLGTAIGRHKGEANIDIARLLLSAGFDPNKWCSLATHLQSWHEDLLRLLFEFGVDASASCEGFDWNELGQLVIREVTMEEWASRFNMLDTFLACKEQYRGQPTVTLKGRQDFIKGLRRELTSCLQPLAREENGIITVAFMRFFWHGTSTGNAFQDPRLLPAR